MPKADESFDPNRYAPVADRITLFYEAYPQGRIVTDLVARENREVVFRARVYRTVSEPKPAATGWASEREGDGDVNTVACLENTETSAIGRALANLGFTASKQRPSAEEMTKVARARAEQQHRSDALQARANQVTDILHLFDRAKHQGLRFARAEHWRAALISDRFGTDDLERFERRLRAWLRKREVGAASVSPAGV